MPICPIQSREFDHPYAGRTPPSHVIHAPLRGKDRQSVHPKPEIEPSVHRAVFALHQQPHQAVSHVIKYYGSRKSSRTSCAVSARGRLGPGSEARPRLSSQTAPYRAVVIRPAMQQSSRQSQTLDCHGLESGVSGNKEILRSEKPLHHGNVFALHLVGSGGHNPDFGKNLYTTAPTP